MESATWLITPIVPKKTVPEAIRLHPSLSPVSPSCVKDDNPAEAHLCLLNRFDQQDEDAFRCFAYEPGESEL